MHYDELLKYFDKFSGFTVVSVLLIGVLAALICMENFANNFISPALSHWCYDPSSEGS